MSLTRLYELILDSRYVELGVEGGLILWDIREPAGLIKEES